MIKEILKHLGHWPRWQLIIFSSILFIISSYIIVEIGHSISVKIFKNQKQCSEMFCFNSKTKVKGVITKRGVARGKLYYCEKHSPMKGDLFFSVLQLLAIWFFCSYIINYKLLITHKKR
ncbi:MAG: hypothetical protein A2X59_06625 [Nitrospirae bacterium GWC2_42_7]|nr:MAG: hypothetical protein A2X59_06625 [Nitrospirae bacterium GWC2_42_7]